ncbi:MAG: hypothetical protein PGN33_19975 [Methylobacterium radiotolerans]
MAAKVTDRELRLQALMLDDPYEQPNLSWAINPDARLLDVLNLYQFKEWPTQKVYCVSCEGHHHKKGFTCITSEGDRLLFGSKCGQDAFGESWVNAEKRIKERYQRQHELLSLDRFNTVLGPMQKAVSRWVRPIGDLANRRIGFASSLEALYQRCHEAAQRSNGMLTIFEKVKQKLGNEPDFVERPYAQLIGRDMFSVFDRTNIVHVVEDTIKAIDAVKANAANTDGVSTTTLKRCRLAMERKFEQIEQSAVAYEAAQDFFSAPSFKLLAEWSWARNVVGERYLFEKGILKQCDTNRGVALLAPLPDLNLEILDLIREYRRGE